MRRNRILSGLAALTLAAWQAGGPALAQVPSAANLENQELDKASTKPLKPGANSFAESQARALLEADGYANVSPLVNDKEGIWHGKAFKNSREVDVSVDYQGHIAAR